MDSSNSQANSQKTIPLRDEAPGKYCCCICQKPPSPARSYYGIVFCADCFHKYIWSTPNKRDCSGDVLNIPGTLAMIQEARTK